MTYIALPLYMFDNEYQFCYKTDELTTHPTVEAAKYHVYHTHNPEAPRSYLDENGVWRESYHAWNGRWQQSSYRWILQFDAADDTELWGYEIVKAANR